jgi:high-affinity iron transporter
MVASLLIPLREGLEAALIVGIVLNLLHRLQRWDLVRPAWAGVGTAVASLIRDEDNARTTFNP